MAPGSPSQPVPPRATARSTPSPPPDWWTEHAQQPRSVRQAQGVSALLRPPFRRRHPLQAALLVFLPHCYSFLATVSHGWVSGSLSLLPGWSSSLKATSMPRGPAQTSPFNSELGDLTAQSPGAPRLRKDGTITPTAPAQTPSTPSSKWASQVFSIWVSLQDVPLPPHSPLPCLSPRLSCFFQSLPNPRSHFPPALLTLTRHRQPRRSHRRPLDQGTPQHAAG